MIIQELFGLNKKKKDRRISKLYTNEEIKAAREYCIKWLEENHNSLAKTIDSIIKTSKYSKNAELEHPDYDLDFNFDKEDNYLSYKKGYFISTVGYWIDPWDLDPKLRTHSYESETGSAECIEKLYEFNEKTMSPKVENWCKSKGLPGAFMCDDGNDWDSFGVYLAVKADIIIQYIKSKGIFESVAFI